MNITLLRATVAAFALAAPFAASAQQLPAAVIAVVDRDRIAGTCAQCVAASQLLQAQGQAYQQRRTQLLTPLQTEGQAIQTAINAIPQGGQPDAALQARARTFETNREAAATELQQREETLRRNQAFVVNQILERMNPLIGQVTRERGANVAVDLNATLAHNPAVNVTDAVLALMNQNTAAFNVTAPPPQQAQQPAGAQPRPAATPPAQQPQRPRPQGR
jgi:Skp family chaperone for outer membrane proteins